MQSNSQFLPGTVAERLGGQIVALDVERGKSLLMSVWPSDGAVSAEVFASTPLVVPKGERFGVARGVAVMPVRGVLTPDSAALERYMGWATYQGVEHVCEEVASRDDVAALVLDVSSPGGMVLGLEGAAQAIAALREVKPVHVLVNPMAASAAYYLASQGSDITMTPGSEAGSIGTMRMSAWPVKPDNYGDQWGVHMSSHARAKNPNPTDEAGLAEIQRSLDEAEAQFLNAVASGRKLDRAGLTARLSVTDDVADGGAMFRASEAIARGLADVEKTRSAFYQDVFQRYAPKPAGRAVRAQGAVARARVAQLASQI